MDCSDILPDLEYQIQIIKKVRDLIAIVGHIRI